MKILVEQSLWTHNYFLRIKFWSRNIKSKSGCNSKFFNMYHHTALQEGCTNLSSLSSYLVLFKECLRFLPDFS